MQIKVMYVTRLTRIDPPGLNRKVINGMDLSMFDLAVCFNNKPITGQVLAGF